MKVGKTEEGTKIDLRKYWGDREIPVLPLSVVARGSKETTGENSCPRCSVKIGKKTSR
jgi:hypothetical protein